jgi:hypothetical protein
LNAGSGAIFSFFAPLSTAANGLPFSSPNLRGGRLTEIHGSLPHVLFHHFLEGGNLIANTCHF